MPECIINAVKVAEVSVGHSQTSHMRKEFPIISRGGVALRWLDPFTPSAKTEVRMQAICAKAVNTVTAKRVRMFPWLFLEEVEFEMA